MPRSGNVSTGASHERVYCESRSASAVTHRPVLRFTWHPLWINVVGDQLDLSAKQIDELFRPLLTHFPFR
jgi:hypothetical protein